MERIPVVMERSDLLRLPHYPLPSGYRLRGYRSGDEASWGEVEYAAGEFPNIQQALDHFKKEFADCASELADRCFFLEDDCGRVIGTGMAWYNEDYRGECYGRLHWIGIHPDYQGRHLGKALVSALMDRLAQTHSKAYLTSQTTSVAAIKIYLDFSFVPVVTTNQDRLAWSLMEEELHHPVLSAFHK